jgi:hypothetical protein
VQNTGFGAYVFFAVFCLLSAIWTFYIVPETSGKSLEDMDAVFKDYGGSDDMAIKNRLFLEVMREKRGNETTA